MKLCTITNYHYIFKITFFQWRTTLNSDLTENSQYHSEDKVLFKSYLPRCLQLFAEPYYKILIYINSRDCLSNPHRTT